MIIEPIQSNLEMSSPEFQAKLKNHFIKPTIAAIRSFLIERLFLVENFVLKRPFLITQAFLMTCFSLQNMVVDSCTIFDQSFEQIFKKCFIYFLRRP